MGHSAGDQTFTSFLAGEGACEGGSQGLSRPPGRPQMHRRRGCRLGPVIQGRQELGQRVQTQD